jgi:prepilin-type N-terminal cleavage/methylation domain-containing protein
MSAVRAPLRSEHGYTLVEMMVALLVIAILGGMAAFQLGTSRQSMLADGAMRSLLGQLNYARELAIAQRRLVEVEFDTENNRLRLQRQDPGGAMTLLREVGFEGAVTYGFPSDVALDTEEGFGIGEPVVFDDADRMLFNTEGMFVNEQGSTMNGTVYLLIPGLPGTYRAITVFGSTGRIRAYRWTGDKWTRI